MQSRQLFGLLAQVQLSAAFGQPLEFDSQQQAAIEQGQKQDKQAKKACNRQENFFNKQTTQHQQTHKTPQCNPHNSHMGRKGYR
jgi:hypothetical protein